MSVAHHAKNRMPGRAQNGESFFSFQKIERATSQRFSRIGCCSCLRYRGSRSDNNRSVTMDRVAPGKRSEIMRAVHTKNTGAELVVRSLAHRLGFRFRLHSANLPGHPDMVFSRHRKVIFVHGCFWHGHRCRYGRPPQSNLQYWLPKLDANKKRDMRVRRQLVRLGWQVLVVWQCQLKSPKVVEKRLRDFLGAQRTKIMNHG